MFNFVYGKSTYKSDLLTSKGRSKRVNKGGLFVAELQ